MYLLHTTARQDVARRKITPRQHFATSLFCSWVQLNKERHKLANVAENDFGIKLPIFIKHDLYDSFSALHETHYNNIA